MKEYLIQFSLTHQEFRIPELLSVAECLGFGGTMTLPPEVEDMSTSRPFLIIRLESDDQALMLAERCVLIKSIFKLYSHGKTYDEIHALNRQMSWSQYADTPFKFIITAVNHRIPSFRTKEVMASFSYLGLRKVDVQNPELTLCCLEEYDFQPGFLKYERDGRHIHVYFGSLISEGIARGLIETFNVKKRDYFGNTSMDAEVSLLMANQAKATKGALVYDPFVGTGSMLYTSAHFGALVVGSDIDGRQMRGKDPSMPGVYKSATQYNIRDRVLDCMTFDVTYNPWHRGGIFDAIVTDPPYGVRAGAKRIGSNDVSKPLRSEPQVLRDGVIAHSKPTYLPPTRAYELADLATDLVDLAYFLLKPGGRLVFFLPTVTDEYQDVDVPACEGMRLVANSLQDFGKWGRRLITMEKIGTVGDNRAPTFRDTAWERRLQAANGETLAGLTEDGGPKHVPAHQGFRTKYFSGFDKDPAKGFCG